MGLNLTLGCNKDWLARSSVLYRIFCGKHFVSSNQNLPLVRKLIMSKKRPPASIGANVPTLGEQFGKLSDRISKIGGQPLPAPKNPRRK